MKKNCLYLLLNLIICLSYLSIPVDAQSCSSYSAIDCLRQKNSCNINYLSTPPLCQSGKSNDGCSDLTSSASCSAAFCFWDPFINNCFVTQYQVSQLYNCSTWTSSSSSGSLSCSFHGCSINPVNNLCVPYFTPNRTDQSNIVLSYTNSVQWANPVVLPNSLLFQVQAIVPLQINLLKPDWAVIGTGAGQTGLASIYSMPSFCTTQRTRMRTAPPEPVTYTKSYTTLVSYLLNWIQTNRHLTFDTSIEEGRVLNQVFGNITIGPNSLVTNVSLSADSNNIIFTIQKDLNWLISNCSSFGNVFGRNNDKTVSYYTLLFSYVSRSSSDAWTSSSAYYQVSIQLNGAVVITTSLDYQTTVAMREAVPLQGICPNGQLALASSFDLMWYHVFDSSRAVGPRSLQDVIISNNSCFRNTITNFQFMGCVSSTCTTRVSFLSACMNVPANGWAFLNCSNAPDARRIADMNGDKPYPLSWNAVHPFKIDSYSCPISRVNDTGCIQLHAPPDVLDSVTAIIQVRAYPVTFITPPPLLINFALLPTDKSQIVQSSSDSSNNNALVGSFNSSNRIVSSPPASVGLLDQIHILVQLDDAILRSTYTLSLAKDQILVLATDSLGNVLTGNAAINASFRQLQAYLVNSPRQFRLASCPSCPSLPACLQASGCDGLSIWSGALSTLLPNAAGFQFYIPYLLTLPTPSGISVTPASSSGTNSLFLISSKKHLFGFNHNRKLHNEQQVDPTPQINVDTSSTSSDSFFVVFSSDISGALPPKSCSGGFRCWQTISQVLIIIVPILFVLLLITIYWMHKQHRTIQSMLHFDSISLKKISAVIQNKKPETK
jgi:hypothetical protein